METSVDLDFRKLRDKDIIKFCIAFSYTSSTNSSISLSNNNFGDKGANALVELMFMVRIKSLILSSNHIGDTGIIALAKALESDKTALEELNISFNEFGNDGAFALANALKVNKTLKTLSLGGNKIDICGISQLKNALKDNYTLCYFDYLLKHDDTISKDDFSSILDDLEIIKSYVARNRHLQKL